MAKFTIDDDDRDEDRAESTTPRRGSFTEGEPPRGGSSGRPPGSRAGSGSRLWVWLVLLGVVAFGGAFAVVNYMVMPHAVKHGDELQVPDLTGAPLDSAQVALQGLGLRVTRSGEVPSLTVPAGRIVSTDPPAGALVKVDRMVSVIISLGPELVKVPSLAGLVLQQARLLLENAGLAAGHVGYGYSEAIPAGMIVASTPSADAAIAPGATVDLRVSLGAPPDTNTMPDVRGRSVDGITELLAGEGYRVSVLGSDGAPLPEGALIVDQYPPPGTTLAPGDSILLVSKQ